MERTPTTRPFSFSFRKLTNLFTDDQLIREQGRSVIQFPGTASQMAMFMDDGSDGPHTAVRASASTLVPPLRQSR